MSRGRCALGIAVAVLAMVTGACSGDTGTTVKGVGDEQPVDEQLARAAVAPVLDLAVELEQHLALASPGAELAVAPLPIAASLSQARSGAGGATAEAFDQVLPTAPRPDGPADLATGVTSLERLLEDRTGEQTSSTGRTGTVSLDLTDSLWFQNGTPFSQAWLDDLAHTWGKGVRTADFRSDPESARRAVNSWTRGTTSGHIDQLAPRGSIPASTRLMSTGAAYLKAPWLTAFDPNDTRLESFRHLDGSTTTVSMMRNPSLPGVRHGRGDGWVAVELPYLGGELSMTVIVPDEGRFAEVEQRLDGSTLTSLVGDLQRGSVDVSLPKFGFTTEVPLTDALRDLGLGTAMDSATADFSTISAEPLWFTAMLHQTYLGIAEQGTEATASKPRSPETTTRPRPVDTAVDDTGLSPGGPTTTAPTALRPASSPDAVVVDRPFLVLVRDRVTGAPLFYGRVLSPNG